ncbi:MAG: orotate phosphoribosyltransferase [Nitrospirae bacterium]|nr:orotate phosphoribosyltransferase [Candidatus Troglogloeales bacterium]MBI3598360.1 orotate phosphoribosyltransferase [Candidatus Troglogloeales bacterium]
MPPLQDKDKLFDLLYNEAFRESSLSEFKLSTGQTSRFYINSKKVSLNAQGAFLIGEAIFEKIKSLPVAGVGGMTLGADPIATAVALVSYMKGKPISGFIVRKERKKHGTEQQIEGPMLPGAKLVVVEDVVTTGSSALQTISILRSEGHTILKVVALVDRLEGGGEKIVAEGVPFEALYTMDDFKKVLPPQ